MTDQIRARLDDLQDDDTWRNDRTLAYDALRAVLDRLDVACDAEQLPENRGKAPCPTNMLRVYIHQDIAEALGVEEAGL